MDFSYPAEVEQFRKELRGWLSEHLTAGVVAADRRRGKDVSAFDLLRTWDATMADGTPNGYAMLTVSAGGTYALALHTARDPADTQIGLHAPRPLRQGASTAWGVYANVYMGRDDSRLVVPVDGRSCAPLH